MGFTEFRVIAFVISEKVETMKRKRKPHEGIVLKIMLLHTLGADCKAIAKKVKYSSKKILEIFDSKLPLPLEEIMKTYDRNRKTIAEHKDYSQEQMRKIIESMQPTVRLDKLNLDIVSCSSTLPSIESKESINKCENVSEMVLTKKYH